jgi:hypothetical protein
VVVPSVGFVRWGAEGEQRLAFTMAPLGADTDWADIVGLSGGLVLAVMMIPQVPHIPLSLWGR